MSISGILIEGGQTWAHRIRMLRQVLKTTVLIALGTSAVIFISLMLNLPLSIYEGTWYHLKANTIGNFTDVIEVDSNFWTTISNHKPAQKNTAVSPEKLSKLTKPHVNSLLHQTLRTVRISGYCSSFTTLLLLLFFMVRGVISKKKRHLSGRRLSSSWAVSLSLKLRRRASPIKIGTLPLVKGTETQHIMVTGGTGSGKTNCFHIILPQIRRLKNRAVVVDTTGVFSDRYFRAGKDLLLNPFEPNSAQWNPWAECSNQFDVEDLCECLIPNTFSEHENYWRTSARTLLSALIQKSVVSKQTSELTRWLLYEPLPSLCRYLQGTKAAAHLDVNSEKTAASIRSVASSFLSCLEYLADTTAPFSIRNWIQTADDDSWLFLSCSPAQRASIRPLLSCWFSLAARSLIQMTPDRNRRIWFIVDELPSLNKLKDLEGFLSESRKYGGCALLALQSLSQLEAIYGRESTKTIIGNCATKIAFSEQDPEIAEKISKAFGEHDILEYHEGLSYGAHESRDGVNLSTQMRTLPVVSVTNLQSLRRHQAFVKLPEDLPITKIQLRITPPSSR